MTAPITRARYVYSLPFIPNIRNNKQVAINTAIVIPDNGLDDEPTIPVILAETTENKKPKITIKIAPSKFIRKVGKSQMNKVINVVPIKTTRMGMSLSVRFIK